LPAVLDRAPFFTWYVRCATPGMDVSDGVTVNAVSPGPPAAPGPPGRIAWAHPPSNTTSAASTTSAERFTTPPLSLPGLLAAQPHPRRQLRGAFQTAARLIVEEYGG